ncbi:hypothetical protein CYMTET_56702 [Cymbomonas tetramitiformis]|uniref:Clostripain n=1 Tax=Cymbomonas tetramitiformis TaxID=36881 RepID=A0AAE0EM15_9CHLO|nr:hypothetical protein CYMTET_56702 [Cymbomonas tetramitiformis]
MRQIRLELLCALFSVLHFSAQEAAAQNDEIAAWTILVYGAGDNNLEGMLVNDIKEMAESGVPGESGSQKVNVVVLADRSDEYNSGERLGSLGNWRGTKTILIENGEFTQLKDEGEADLTDTNVLFEFISRGIESFPAESYALFLWDHGMGWQGFGEDTNTGTGSKRVWDGAPYETSEPTMTLESVREAIAEGLSASRVERLDILGFDACLMQQYTVVANMAPYAHYFLASEDLEPGAGWDWTALSAAVANPSISPIELAREIILKFSVHHGGQRPLTLSTVSRTGFNSFLVAFRLLISEINNLLENLPYGDSVTVYTTLFKLRASSQMVKMDGMDSIDLGTMLTQLEPLISTVPRIQRLVASALIAYREMVIDHFAPPEAEGNTGMAIYWPKTKSKMDQTDLDWIMLTPPFLDIDGVSSWQTFLNNYYAAAETCRAGCTAQPYLNIPPGSVASPPPVDFTLQYEPDSVPMESLTVQGSWIEDAYGAEWPGFYRMIGDLNSAFVSSAQVALGYASSEAVHFQSSTNGIFTYPANDKTRVIGESDGLMLGMSDEPIADATAEIPSSVKFAPVFAQQEYQYNDNDGDGALDEEIVTYTATVKYTQTDGTEVDDCNLIYFANFSTGAHDEYEYDDYGAFALPSARSAAARLVDPPLLAWLIRRRRPSCTTTAHPVVPLPLFPPA